MRYQITFNPEKKQTERSTSLLIRFRLYENIFEGSCRVILREPFSRVVSRRVAISSKSSVMYIWASMARGIQTHLITISCWGFGIVWRIHRLGLLVFGFCDRKPDTRVTIAVASLKFTF
jgi:hypothetical protein